MLDAGLGFQLGVLRLGETVLVRIQTRLDLLLPQRDVLHLLAQAPNLLVARLQDQ